MPARVEFTVRVLESGADWGIYVELPCSLHGYSGNNVWQIVSQRVAAFEVGPVDAAWPLNVAGINTSRALGGAA